MTGPKRIRIGMISTLAGLGETALTAAHAAHMQGADFFYFTAKDVDVDGGTITGAFFQGETWVRRSTPFPDVIENNIAHPIDQRVWRALVERCRVTTPLLGSKSAVDQAMRQSRRFDDLLIPTHDAVSVGRVRELLREYGRIVLKPVHGQQGRGIIYVARDEDALIVNDGKGDRAIAPAAFDALIESRIASEDYLAQRYVESRTRLGQPFDVRIQVRRDGKGDWQQVRLLARIGSGDNITANVTNGGAISPLKQFIEHRYGAQADEVLKRLAGITRQFPPAFQSLYPTTPIPALGLDVGIDPSGRPHLFEVNSNPSAQLGPFIDAAWRIGYAIHLVRNPASNDGAGPPRVAG